MLLYAFGAAGSQWWGAAGRITEMRFAVKVSVVARLYSCTWDRGSGRFFSETLIIVTADVARSSHATDQFTSCAKLSALFPPFRHS